MKKDIKLLANSKKINRKSEQILANKLEQDLEIAFISVDRENTKLVNFEKIGRILFLMNVFDIIKYDEDCRGNP